MGAFKLAIDHERPMVVVSSGAGDLLPKHSMIFQERARVRVRVLEPIPTKGLGADDVEALANRTRDRMTLDQLAPKAP